MTKQNYIVDADWVVKHLSDSDIVIIDCRFDLNDPSSGQKQYENGHLPNARYFHLEEDLSGPKKEHGGRHPLPDLNQFIKKLGSAGIDENVTVIIYDDQNGMVAARLWWMLTYLGQSSTYVLDGGFSKWVEKGYPVSTDKPSVTERSFTAKINHDMLVDMEKVQEKLRSPDSILVDSRAIDRYLGIQEPMDAKAGHIPGAVNFFWGDNLSESGEWKPEQTLKQRFKALDEKKEVIVYCGSGVSACPNVLAMKEAGLANVKLYIGSWSDWISYPDNPIETKKRMI